MAYFSKKLGIVALLSVSSAFAGERDDLTIRLLPEAGMQETAFGDGFVAVDLSGSSSSDDLSDVSGISINSHATDSGNSSTEFRVSQDQLAAFFKTPAGKALLQEVKMEQERSTSPVFENKGKLAGFIGKCFNPIANLYNKLSGAVEDTVVDHPKTILMPFDIGGTGAMSICLSNYFRGEIFPVMAQAVFAESIVRNVKILKLPLALELGTYALGAYATFELEKSVGPNFNQNPFDPNNGFETGLPKAFVIMGALRTGELMKDLFNKARSKQNID